MQVYIYIIWHDPSTRCGVKENFLHLIIFLTRKGLQKDLNKLKQLKSINEMVFIPKFNNCILYIIITFLKSVPENTKTRNWQQEN